MRPQYEYRVGFFTFVAVLMLIFAWGWLKSFSLFHPPQHIQVQFHDIAGLNKNATVNINGVRVGVVEEINLKGKGDVICLLKINTESVVIPKGSKFTIQTLGLVGAKYMEITLPELKEGEPPPPAIEADAVIAGEDPVRVELVVNKIATNLAKVDYAAVGERLNHDLERFGSAADSVTSAATRFGTVADNAKGASNEAKNFFSRGTKSFDQLGTLASSLKSSTGTSFRRFDDLATDWRLTSNKLNKILDNPALSSDLKETVEKARETADKINTAMQSLSGTLKDQPVRQDLLTMMERLNRSTENIAKSMEGARSITNDQTLRADLKESLTNFKDAMSKVDEIMSKPNVEVDLKQTMAKLNVAAGHVDLAARQVNQVLNNKRPLWKLFWGRPGYIKEAQASKAGDAPAKDKTKPRSGGDVPIEQQPHIDSQTAPSSTLTPAPVIEVPRDQPVIIAPAVDHKE